jgi:hypothetical protein
MHGGRADVFPRMRRRAQRAVITPQATRAPALPDGWLV